MALEKNRNSQSLMRIRFTETCRNQELIKRLLAWRLAYSPQLLVALLLILGGCGSEYYFSKPGFSQQQYDRDNFECLKAAQQPVLITPTPGMPAGGMATNKDIYFACFRAKGYTVQSEEEREQIVRAEERANRERLVQQREHEKQLRRYLIHVYVEGG